MASSSPASSAVTFLPQGALIRSFVVAGQNIALGLPSPALYKTHNAPYFGETIGRVSNRIAGAKLSGLNGKTYKLDTNDGPNCLHGGAVGWGKKDWSGPNKTQRAGKEALEFAYTSADGDGGFPGTVECRVWYTVSEERDRVVLDAEYEVRMPVEQPEGVEETVVAVTNHCYFTVCPNQADVRGTVAQFPSALHLPVDANKIPTGKIEPYPGIEAQTPVTFTATEPSPDHCFVADAEPSKLPLDTRQRPLSKLIRIWHPDTQIGLDVSSTEPAFQVYSGEGINIPALEGQPALGSRKGIAIEPSRYVDAASRPEWRGMVYMKKGSVYGSKSRYVAWKGARDPWPLNETA